LSIIVLCILLNEMSSYSFNLDVVYRWNPILSSLRKDKWYLSDKCKGIAVMVYPSKAFFQWFRVWSIIISPSHELGIYMGQHKCCWKWNACVMIVECIICQIWNLINSSAFSCQQQNIMIPWDDHGFLWFMSEYYDLFST